MAITIEPLSVNDSLEELADVVRRAGFSLSRGVSTNRSADNRSADLDVLAAQVASGECFVAKERGAIIATVLYRSPSRTCGCPGYAGSCPWYAGSCPWYDRPDVASFSQLAVDPRRQGRGLGSLLLSWVEEKARHHNAAELAFDVPEQAQVLIQYCQGRGYRPVDSIQQEGGQQEGGQQEGGQQEGASYRSVVLSKNLEIGHYMVL